VEGAVEQYREQRVEFCIGLRLQTPQFIHLGCQRIEFGNDASLLG
jgi:hypothetical protein